MIGKLFGRSRESAADAPSVDPALGDAAVGVLREQLADGNYAPLRDYLTVCEDLERRDFVILQVLADLDVGDEWIQAWTDEEPTSTLPLLVHGRYLIDRAWAARTGYSAKSVSDDQWRVFFGLLEQAWSRFEVALHRLPVDSSTYAFMIDAAKGLQLPLADAHALYERAQSGRPWQAIAQHSMTQFLAPKWHGSAQQVLEFARSIDRDAPEGSDAHSALASAHVEIWLAEGRRDDYWRSETVRSDVAGAAARSIESGRYDSPWAARTRNTFAFCFWKMGERERAARQFLTIGPVVAGPFRFNRDPVGSFKKARREVGAA